jgi:hypothetical protein
MNAMRAHRAWVRSLLLLVSSTFAPSTAPGQTSPLQILVNETRDTVTVIGSRVPRSVILRELRTKYGIDIRPMGLADATISPRIVSAPLVDAIRQLLPAGTRYGLRVEGELSDIRGKSGPKVGPPDNRPGLPRKRTRGVGVPAPGQVRKRSPMDTARPSQATQNVKPRAATVASVPASSGPKVQVTRSLPDSSIRLTFEVRSTLDSIRLVRVQLVEGRVPVSRVVQGPLLFAIRGTNGRLIHFGALLDPLEQHGHQPEGPHDARRAREGTFALWLPREAIRATDAAPFRVEFLDARQVTLPIVLDQAAFERAARQARPAARISLRGFAATGSLR